MTTIPLPARAAIAALLVLLLPAASAAGVRIVDAWVQESPPSVPVQAGYLTLENDSAATIIVTAVRSPLAERVEIHRSDITENTATMTRITELPIPARSKLSFGPGGYHLMIYGTKEAPRAGSRFPLEVTTADGTTIKADAAVRGFEDDSGASSVDDGDHAGQDHH